MRYPTQPVSPVVIAVCHQRPTVGAIHIFDFVGEHGRTEHQPAFVLREASRDEWLAYRATLGLPSVERPEVLGYYAVSMD